MTKPIAVLFVLVALIAAACGGAETATSAGDTTDTADAGAAATDAEPGTEAADEPAEEETAADDTEADAQGSGDATVTVASSDLGDILADGENATLYLFVPDDQSDSTCYDDCEQNWPPLLGPAEAGEGVDAALLGTVQREDGTTQVTYNDWPLYYFAGDSAPGDTAGQGVGDVWFVVDPEGEAVQDTATSQGRGY